MGSDSSPSLIFDAVIQALEQLDPSLKLVVLATKPIVAELEPLAKLKLQPEKLSRLTFYPTADFIGMIGPLNALRQKKGSSIALGIRLLKKKQIDAFVSAGNTGALIASATISLPKLPGITRPALLRCTSHSKWICRSR